MKSPLDLIEASSLLEKTIPNVPRGTSERILRYIDLTLTWNQKTNLTGAKTPQEFFFQHVIDCANAFSVCNFDTSWIDVGTGAGLPGIIWSLLAPDSYFYLIEASKKRSSFLHRVQSELKLQNIRIINERFERVTTKSLKNFEVVRYQIVSRGTSAPQDLLPLAKKTLLPWEAWVIFSNQKIHSQYLTLSPAFEIQASLIEYPFFFGEKPGNHGQLTILKKIE